MSDDDDPVFSTREEKLAMKQARKDSLDAEQARRAQLRAAMADSDDDVAVFKPRRRVSRVKAVPKPTFLERALASVKEGKGRLDLMGLTIEADMDRKLADLLLYVEEHPYVFSVELQVLAKFEVIYHHASDDRMTLQGTPLGAQNGMPRSMSAIIQLVRARRILFLGLTKTGLDDSDGDRLATALLATPLRAAGCGPGVERLDLTQINFGPAVRARLLEAGARSGVHVYMSQAGGPALRPGR